LRRSPGRQPVGDCCLEDDWRDVTTPGVRAGGRRRGVASSTTFSGYNVSSASSVCASLTAGSSGVGEKPSSAGASVARASAWRFVRR
jgi:hypothetical protein